MIPPLTLLSLISDAPVPGDLPNFNPRIGPFFASLALLCPELNDFISAINSILPIVESASANAGLSAAPAYDGGATYNYPDIVAGSNGHSYRCKGTLVSGDDPVGSVTGNWFDMTPGMTSLFNLVVDKSAAYPVAGGDKGKLLRCTGTWTLGFLDASVAGTGFTVIAANVGSGVITIGSTGVVLDPGQSCFVTSDGAAWTVSGLPQPGLSKRETYYPGVTTDSNYTCIDSTPLIWSRRKSLGTARRYIGGAKLPSGRFLLVGGYATDAVATCEIFDPATGGYSPAAALPQAKYGIAIAALADGRVWAGCGHGTGSNIYTSCHVYDEVLDAWTLDETALPLAARFYAWAAGLLDGRLMFGGGTNGSVNYADCLIYNPTANTIAGLPTKQWTTVMSHPGAAKRLADACVLPDGRVFVFGGYTTAVVATGYLYTVGTNTWSPPTKSNPTARHSPMMGTLLDGRPLVVGGFNGSMALASSHVYDPGVDDWFARPSLLDARAGAAFAILADGRPAIAGGYYADASTAITNKAECCLLDINNTWRRS